MKKNPRPPKRDFTNHTFGHLTVIRMAQTEKSERGSWRCICKCNLCGIKIVDVSVTALSNGSTTSCGCRRDQYKKITGKNSKQFTGFEEIPGKMWSDIKAKSILRDFVFEITIDYAWNLFILQNRKCALSGVPIKFGSYAKRKSNMTASLDRINSKKGYIDGNVQWVHKTINRMKNVFDQDYFVEMCKNVAEFYVKST